MARKTINDLKTKVRDVRIVRADSVPVPSTGAFLGAIKGLMSIHFFVEYPSTPSLQRVRVHVDHGIDGASFETVTTDGDSVVTREITATIHMQIASAKELAEAILQLIEKVDQ